MKTRRLKVVAKDMYCDENFNCPTIARTESGSYVIVGKKLDQETAYSLKLAAGGELADDEYAVEIPAHLIEEVARDLGA